MKKFGALLVMLSAISFAVLPGCQGSATDGGDTDGAGETGGDEGSGDEGSGDEGN